MKTLKRALLSAVAVLLLGVIAFTTAVNVGAFAAPAEQEQGLKVNAKSGLLMDYNTGTVVFEQNSKDRMPIASMVKIMTLLITFEELDAGNLTLDTDIAASENATSMGGSQAFLDTGSSYKLEELIKSIVVGSANDSCVAVAEHISGDVTSFVSRMNEKAAALGMENTNFVNCTGLPAPNQYCCAFDVGLMTREMLSHPQFYNFSTVWMFDFKHPSGRVTQLSNTNKLIRAYEGCDGGKTGFTNEAMYCLSATAKRGNTRLISVVMGAETSKIRNGENAKLFNYGFANYETRQLVTKGALTESDFSVEKGKVKTVKGIAKDDFYSFVKKNSKSEVVLEECVEKICAPVAAGDKIGDLKVIVDGVEIGSVDLLSESDSPKIGYLDILDDVIARW